MTFKHIAQRLHDKPRYDSLLIALMLVGCSLEGSQSDAADTPEIAIHSATAALAGSAPVGHPGTGPWEVVPEDRVLEQCRLDPAALASADKALAQPWVAIRYGRVCHAYRADERQTAEAYSVTKLLATTVAGAVAYQTRELTRTGRKTGPFSDEDRVDFWTDYVSYNRDAHVAHVLGMVAQSPDLRFGHRSMEYDFFGVVQLDSLNGMLGAAIAQRGANLGGDLEGFTQRYVFGPLGVRSSTWSLGLPNKTFAYGWNTNVLDMARIGLLVLRHGVVNDTRVLDEEWAYRMTHPSFEDANTGMGYCTWLNAAANFSTGTMPTPASWTDVTSQPRFPGPCAPVSVYREHPHGLSEARDCNYGAARGCEQAHDVGVWQSFAGWGTVIQGHPGLDLLLVAWQVMPDDFFAAASSGIVWDAVRPAVVNADPQFRGDERAFCAAYGGNQYAPDAR